jgi:glycerol-3-phosphate dehydrogenase (NAD(P)+)
MRRVVEQLRPRLDDDCLLVSAAKGIENDTLLLMSEVLADVLGAAVAGRSAYLSGPSFAREVAAELPTAVAVAAADGEVARTVQDLFRTDYFRVYTNPDVIGVEIGGALKNVIALAAGVSDGLGFGHNARAALINRGLVEMARLGAAKGAQAETFAGLAGMGDLVLTCTGDLSRNRTVGIELGRGRKLGEILSGMRMVAEGVKTTLSAYQLAQKLGVVMPITEQMYQILYQDKAPRQAVNELMQRQQKAERH